ncbi:MAG: hypothetical protein HYZ42_15000, partial [Bacteroidetes bacterium]|nr:hypothetical protein [Bacteroidota bacterium]
MIKVMVIIKIYNRRALKQKKLKDRVLFMFNYLNYPLLPALALALSVARLSPAALAAAPSPAAWQSLRTPGFWEKQFGGTVEKHDGFAWYRCFVEVPSHWQGQDLILQLGQIDDCDETFFNGNQVGAKGKREPFQTASGEARSYRVQSGDVRYGAFNLLAVRVFDNGGAGGIAAGPLRLSSSKGALELSGNWHFRLGDDLAWAKWETEPGSEQGKAVALAVLKDAGAGFGQPLDFTPLPGTSQLTLEGDIASQLVAGVDKFL